jgi:hypothetical protein
VRKEVMQARTLSVFYQMRFDLQAGFHANDQNCTKSFLRAVVFCGDTTSIPAEHGVIWMIGQT